MPTQLVVTFPLGRYHATPWGRQVNEGVVEWPPSGWRILRALYSVWKLRTPELDPAVVESLLRKLSSPPLYFVPPHRRGHTRHYYPDTQHRAGKPSTDRTLDTFITLDRRAELGIWWREDLDPEETKTLDRLAGSLPYLGRADSICEAQLDPDWTPTTRHARVAPLDLDPEATDDHHTVDLLNPDPPLDLDALTARPVDIRARKLLYPPGTRRVPYGMPDTTTPPPPLRSREPKEIRPQAVRFQITSTALPPITETVAVADLIRAAALRKLGDLRDDPDNSLLAGKDSNGQPLRNHRHAHYLPLDTDGDGRLDQIVIWTPAGLPEDELRALDRIRRLWSPHDTVGPDNLRLTLTSYGTTNEVLPGLACQATSWRSVTPFAPPRHPKRRSPSDFYAAELARELNHRGHPAPVTAEFTNPERAAWVEYRRYRPTKENRAHGRPAHGIGLRFSEPVGGPLLLGALSHFGLGLFAPDNPAA